MIINIALKEWDLVCSALLSGKQSILLRKGGILDSGNHFELEHDRFWLFPTFIHQGPNMTKPAYRPGLKQLREEPTKLEIKGYAEVADIFTVPSRPAMDRLRDLHVWDEPLIDMRFAYRPEKPLYLVVVKAFRLPHPIIIENTFSYAGCKSWVPLEQPLDTDGAVPALADDAFAAQFAIVKSALS